MTTLWNINMNEEIIFHQKIPYVMSKKTREKQKIIVITGASSGIGQGLARLFSQNNFKVILIARNLEAMKQLKLKNMFCYQLDVTNQEKISACVQDIENCIGPINFWINNAGVGFDGSFCDITHEQNNAMVDVNLKGIIHCMEVILPLMQKRRSGMIINISSLADRVSRPNLAVYAATKAAVKSLSESLRAANAKYGIRICNVAPAKIQTPLLKNSSLKQNEVISVADFAKIIFWITQQPKEICVRDIVIAPTKYEA